MAISNGLNEVSVYHSIQANSHGVGTVNGTSFDAGAEDQVVFIANFGAGAATSTVTIKVQESADNSAWTDVTGATTGTIDRDAGGGSQSYTGVVNANATKRYLRAVAVVTNAAFNFSVTAIGTPVYSADATVPVFNV